MLSADKGSEAVLFLLETFKELCQDWLPSAVMVDFDEAERRALTVFKQKTGLRFATRGCYFHLVQKTERKFKSEDLVCRLLKRHLKSLQSAVGSDAEQRIQTHIETVRHTLTQGQCHEQFDFSNISITRRTDALKYIQDHIWSSMAMWLRSTAPPLCLDVDTAETNVRTLFAVACLHDLHVLCLLIEPGRARNEVDQGGQIEWTTL